MEILYEDNHVIAVNKPHGLLTQADESGDPSLMDQVKEFIKLRDSKPGNVFLGLLHRLDRPVGGVVLFAKTSKGASRLSDQFRKHTIQKIYLAVVEGTPESAGGSVVQWLKKDEATNFVTAFDREVPGSQKAETTYKVLKSADGRSLIQIAPRTGRSHQIRVAMATLGTPIIGDLKYGAKTKLEHNVALFAQSLIFDQAITREKITVVAKPMLSIFF